jgi:hypothetical protein
MGSGQALAGGSDRDGPIRERTEGIARLRESFVGRQCGLRLMRLVVGTHLDFADLGLTTWLPRLTS